MADLGRIKRNIAKMVEQNAPETDIDAYINSEGVTLNAVRTFKDGAASPEVTAEAAFRRKLGAGGMPMRITDSATFGAAIPISAALEAGGKTVGKVISGQPTDFVGDYKFSRDVQDQILKQSRDEGGVAGHVAEIGLSLPFFGGKSRQAVDAASQGPAQLINSGRNYIGQLWDTAKGGALYGGIYGANSARGGVGEHVEGTAVGAGLGAVLSPALKMGIDGTVIASRLPGRAANWLASKTPEDIAAAQVMKDDFLNSGVREFGPAITPSGTQRRTAEGLAGSIFGTPLRREAQGAIDDATRAVQYAVRDPIGNVPVHDAGAEAQQILRRNLAEPSIQSQHIRNIPDSELARITGPIDDRGFSPTPPQVRPVSPRPVPPVRPEPINPDAVPFEIVRPANVNRPDVRPQYPRVEDMPIPRQAQDLVAKRENTEAIARKHLNDAWDDFSRQAQARGLDPNDVIMGRSPITNMDDYPLVAARQAYMKLDAEHKQAIRAVQEGKAVASEAQRQAWAQASRDVHARALAEAEAEQIRLRASAAREADATTQSNRARAVRQAEADAQASARARQAQLEREAADEADRLTQKAQFEAQQKYDAERRSMPVFEPGRSAESYPTEFSAAYEQVARRMPDSRNNPMGGPTAEGRAAKSATKSVVDDLEAEARRRLYLKGPAVDDNGAVTPEFEAYLKSRFGGEIGRRIAELSRTQPGHSATTPRALKELRTEIRTAAERAESPPYPELPRTAEAAALRQLHGALTSDLDRYVRQSGGPPKRFTTETQTAEYVGPGSTKMGDMQPSDITIYVKPEHLDRFSRSPMPNDHKGVLPATRQIDVDNSRRTIAIKRNDTGEIDAATRVPFGVKPEVGLRPVQIWRDGAQVHYASPVTSRSRTPGEDAADLMRGVDAAYGRHMDELRRPLGRLFGNNVDPVKALGDLSKAAEIGDLKLLRPYMRVMTEKADPLKGALTIIAHKTNGAQTLQDFVTGYKSLHPDAKAVLFASEKGQAARRSLDRLANVAERLAPFEKAARGGAVDLTNRANITVGITAMAHFFPAMVMSAGAIGAARFMASPRYAEWMVRTAAAKTPRQVQIAYGQLGGLIGNDASLGDEMKAKFKTAVDEVAGVRPARAAGGPDQAASEPADDTEAEQASSRYADMIAKAAQAQGIEPGRAPPQSVVDTAWDANPTDEMALAIEHIAKRYQLKLPWDR